MSGSLVFTGIVLLVGVACAAVPATVLADAPHESLPAPSDFHPAYSLERGSPEPVAPGAEPETETVLQEHPDHLPATDDPVAQGFAAATVPGDVEHLLVGPRPIKVAVLPPAVVPAEPHISFISPGPDEEWVEGAPKTISWFSSGPISQVRIYYYFDRCALGGRSRGRFGALVTPMTANHGEYLWARVPWMDATGFRIRIAGYDAADNLLAADERGVRFRPRELVGLPPTCIAVIKRKQRLYYYVDGRVQRMHVVSTGRFRGSTPNMRPGSHDRRRGAMGQVFRKATSAWSRSYRVDMPYWLQITSSGSHGIHATSPPYYPRLGSPASAGCIRQHRSDAAELYRLVPVGMPVYIF